MSTRERMTLEWLALASEVHQGLTMAEKLTLLGVASYTDSDGFVEISTGSLCRYCSGSPEEVDACLQSLYVKGILTTLVSHETKIVGQLSWDVIQLYARK